MNLEKSNGLELASMHIFLPGNVGHPVPCWWTSGDQ